MTKLELFLKKLEASKFPLSTDKEDYIFNNGIEEAIKIAKKVFHKNEKKEDLMANPITTNIRQFPLHPLTVEEVESFLTFHPKYLCNPLTDQERALIRDIISVCQPMISLESRFPLSLSQNE